MLGSVPAVSDEQWLVDTRNSYDTVAASYAELLRDLLAGEPYERGALAILADLVRSGGGGPVVDVGCGTGRITAHLDQLGLDARGVDLSPAMIAQARQEHPGLRFDVGSMTELELPEGSVAGLLAWWSLIHVPDAAVPDVLARFRRALRPGGVLVVGFFVGDEVRLKTEGYGGHPMRVQVYRRPPERVAAWLAAAGFTVETRLLLDPPDKPPAAILFARPTG